MSAETKFTPGPLVALQDNETQFTVQNRETGIVVAIGVTEPNAYLIVAAPDLYAALAKVCESPDGAARGFEEGHAALAKARGKS